MERLFLDANVLFTPTISLKGTANGLFELQRAEACALVTSAYAIDEARRNVRAKYPASSEELEELIGDLEVVAEAEASLVQWAEELLPPKDAPILATAVAAKVSVLVTGDRRHFGELFQKNTMGVVVLTPRMALERVLDS